MFKADDSFEAILQPEYYETFRNHVSKGERKGTNKYYPPDYDPRRGGLNKFMGTHALRERASKLHLGILVIRFEMPFNVWCEGCGNHVGMGVRYNAEKKQVGMYYTTPIFEFRMKCHLCDNYYVIRTDPEHFDYQCVEGLRRQENRWDMSENEQIASMEKEKSRKLAADAMYKLEHVESDEAKARAAEPEMAKLEALQSRMKDDFARNQELRRLFRTRKKELKKEADIDQDLLKRSSLGISLVPETDDDRRLASMIAQYRTVETVDEKRRKTLEHLDKKSIFAASLKRVAIRKRPLTTSSTASTSASSGSSNSGGEFRKVANIELLTEGVRESAVTSKLQKLDRDLGLQQATASKLVIRKKDSGNTESLEKTSAFEIDNFETSVDKSFEKQTIDLNDDGNLTVGSPSTSAKPAVPDESSSASRQNNLALLMQSYAGSSDSGSSSDGD